MTQCFQTREQMMKHLVRSGSVVGEVGVFDGTFSQFILDALNPRELHLIDPWPEHELVSSGDQNGQNVRTYTGQQLYETVVQKFKPHENVFVHRAYSPMAFLWCPDHYFDILYLDGLHTYDGLLNDLRIGARKVKDRGWLTGHDFEIPDLQRAVGDFCAETGLSLQYLALDGCLSFAIDVRHDIVPKPNFNTRHID